MKQSMTLRLSEQDMERLRKIAEIRYRGVSRNKAIELLVEDAWTELVKAEIRGG